ncbi:MAG TPA: hypothetical protein VIL37_06045 [Natronosporangium sp.]
MTIPSWLTGPYQERCRAASEYVGPRRAAVAGRSAAWLLGARLVSEAEPIEVVTPWEARFGPVTGLRIHVADLPEAEVEVVDGIRRTNATRTCWDLAQWLPLPEAVAYLDVLTARRLVSREALTAYARRRAGQRGWRRLLRAVSFSDPGAASASESRSRVRAALANRRSGGSDSVSPVSAVSSVSERSSVYERRSWGR